jgi:hypothetical protein
MAMGKEGERGRGRRRGYDGFEMALVAQVGCKYSIV